MKKWEGDEEAVGLDERDGVLESSGCLCLDPSRVASGEVVRVKDGFRVRSCAGGMHHHQGFISGGFKRLFVGVVLIPAIQELEYSRHVNCPWREGLLDCCYCGWRKGRLDRE